MDKPRIKSLRIYKILGKDEEKILHLHRDYDAKGNKLKEISCSADGEITEEKNLSYDEAGKLIEEKNHYAEDEVTEVVRFEYAIDNRLIKTHKSYGEQGDEDTTYYSYNADGMLVEKRTESSEGETEHKEIWKYDGKKLIENVVTDFDGKILESSKFAHNQSDELTEEIRYTSETEQSLKIIYDFLLKDKNPDTTVYNKEGNIIQRTRHTYDDKQRLVKEVTETVNKGVQKFTTVYLQDENNNVTEISVVDKNENLISKIVYKHNNYHLPIEEIHFEEVAPGMDLRQTTTLTEYEFY